MCAMSRKHKKHFTESVDESIRIDSYLNMNLEEWQNEDYHMFVITY